MPSSAIGVPNWNSYLLASVNVKLELRNTSNVALVVVTIEPETSALVVKSNSLPLALPLTALIVTANFHVGVGVQSPETYG